MNCPRAYRTANASGECACQARRRRRHCGACAHARRRSAHSTPATCTEIANDQPRAPRSRTVRRTACSSAARGAAGVSALLRRVCTVERKLDHTGSAESLSRLWRHDAPGVRRGLSHYGAAGLLLELVGSMDVSPSTSARDPTGTAAWSQPATRTRGARGHESAPVNTPPACGRAERSRCPLTFIPHQAIDPKRTLVTGRNSS